MACRGPPRVGCPSTVFTVTAESIDELRSGRFWDADAPERTIPGWLDLSGRWPVLHLGESLTSPWKVVSRTESADGTVATSFGFADDGPERLALTVHGQLRGPEPTAVTLVGAWSAGHRQVSWPWPASPRPGVADPAGALRPARRSRAGGQPRHHRAPAAAAPRRLGTHAGDVADHGRRR